MPGTPEGTTLRGLAWVVAVALLARSTLAVVYVPASFADSATYLRFAEQIVALDLSGYDGWRTPGYPLLLAALARDDRWIMVAQALMGAVTTAMLYLMVLGATRSRWAGVLAALAHALALNQLFLEASVLAETFASFLLVAVLYSGLRAWRRGWRPGDVWLLGLLCAGAALVRPLYVVAGGVILALVVAFGRQQRIRSGAVFLLCFTLPLLGWFSFNQAALGYFGMTTLLGYNLTNHSGAFMEKAPAEYATIRDIYLKHRAQRLADGKSHAMTIFEAREDLKAATGLTDVQLSREFQRLSMRLFAEHPFAYLAGVGPAWAGFWAVPTYWKPQNLRWQEYRDALERMAAVQKWLFRAGYAGFLALALPVLWIAWIRKRGEDAGWNTAGLFTATVLAASLLQALLEYGENPRYALPTQSIAMAAVIVAITLVSSRKRRAELWRSDKPTLSADER